MFGEHTIGEVKALIAPILAMNAEDIREFIIIASSDCPNCGSPHAVTTTDSALGEDFTTFMSILINAIAAHPDMKDDPE